MRRHCYPLDTRGEDYFRSVESHFDKEAWSKEAWLLDLRPLQSDLFWMVHLQRDLEFGIFHQFENAL